MCFKRCPNVCDASQNSCDTCLCTHKSQSGLGLYSWVKKAGSCHGSCAGGETLQGSDSTGKHQFSCQMFDSAAPLTPLLSHLPGRAGSWLPKLVGKYLLLRLKPCQAINEIIPTNDENPLMNDASLTQQVWASDTKTQRVTITYQSGIKQSVILLTLLPQVTETNVNHMSHTHTQTQSQTQAL